MKFYQKTIVFQELPYEISLCYSITGCGKHCKGCHSPWLQDINKGENLTLVQYQKDIDKVKRYISAVVFLGGEWDEYFIDFLKIAKKNGLKTCLYTSDTFDTIQQNKKDLLLYLDYIKVGEYIEAKGGLGQSTTNQKMYNILSVDPLVCVDITSNFLKGEE